MKRQKLEYIIFLSCFLFSSHIWACQSIPPLYDYESQGPHLRSDTDSFCYAYSLSNSLKALGVEAPQPLRLAYQVHRNLNNGISFSPRSFKEFESVDIDRFNDSTLKTIMAQGYCTEPVSTDYISESGQLDLRDFERKCNPKFLKVLKNIRPVFVSLRSHKEMSQSLRIIDHFLERKSPVVFQVSQSLFHPMRDSTKGHEVMYHSMVIIGSRELENKSCEYMVQDSAPESSCQNYSSIKNKDCRQGILWIPENQLRNAISSLIGFR